MSKVTEHIFQNDTTQKRLVWWLFRECVFVEALDLLLNDITYWRAVWRFLWWYKQTRRDSYLLVMMANKNNFLYICRQKMLCTSLSTLCVSTLYRIDRLRLNSNLIIFWMSLNFLLLLMIVSYVENINYNKDFWRIDLWDFHSNILKKNNNN